MKRLLRIFELSANEQRVVLIIMLILITIALVAYGRRNHHSPIDSAVATAPKPSASVVEAAGDK
jgi:hypothetical protein